MPTLQDLIDNGTLRLNMEVLGELRTTRDGCLIASGADVWILAPSLYSSRPGVMIPQKHNTRGGTPSVCYSTRAAALAAKEKEPTR